MSSELTVVPIGHVSSPLRHREDAPKQGNEGSPPAWLVLDARVQAGSKDLRAGEEILVLCWLDRADREVLTVHPRDDPQAPMRGVFSTRSQDRPNPVGIHRVKILEVESAPRFKVADLEALDGTPIVDIKPVIDRLLDR